MVKRLKVFSLNIPQIIIAVCVPLIGEVGFEPTTTDLQGR